MSDTTTTINSPNVNNPVTDYTNITFQPGDRVYVTAGGCVQTGGSGATWKQYVNPSGGNADRLYHGRIWIPGATMGLETIASVINRSPVIVATPPSSADTSEMYLRLGYDDDNYSDNGYWGHDNGTENQCLNVGNAWVSIRIVRVGDGGQTRTCPSYSYYNTNIDPFWNALDANLLPLNPVWGEQCGSTTTNVDVYGACGGSGAYVNSVQQPDPTCTTFLPTTDTKDAPFGLCSSPYSVNGHMNWGLATYTGTSYWQEYDSGITGDDDFNMLLRPVNEAGLTVHNGTIPDRGYPNPDIGKRAMQIEFSAAETVHHGGTLTPAWYTFGYGSDLDRENLIDGRPAIAIGLLGMDMVHEIAAELHPMLGLAVQTKSPLKGDAEEVWMVMVRHSGDEGECSHSDLHYLHGFEAHNMRFALGTFYGNPQVNGSTSQLWNGNSFQTFSAVRQPNGTVLLTVPNPPAGQVVLGEIHISG